MTKETANNSNITIFSSTQNSYMASARDLLKGFAFWRLWNLLAWNTLNLRFKRSWLGLWWISLSFAVFAIVKIFIFGPVMREEIAFFGPFLVIGFLFYRFALKLKDICKEHAGPVIFADIIKNRDGRSAGFGHVEFKVRTKNQTFF